MYYLIFTIRPSENDATLALPIFESVALELFDRYNKKVLLYTLEGEMNDVKSAFNQLAADPTFLIHEIDQGEAPFKPSSSSVWLWKQVARHFSEEHLP